MHKIRSFVKVYPSIIYAWFWFEYIKWFLRRSSHVRWLAGSSETTLKVHTLRMDKAKFDSNWANLHVWGGKSSKSNISWKNLKYIKTTH
jgi:hypothetical protein